MIFFCEDCGEKKLLDSTQLKEGKVVFRCDACNYLNSYPVQAVQEMVLKKITSFFEKLHLFPEIIGSFLFHKKLGVLKNNMPGILKKTDLDILGKILAKNFLACQAQYPDVNEMALIISNKNMVIKMIDNNLAVIIAGKTFPLSKNIMDQLAHLVSNDNA